MTKVLITAIFLAALCCNVEGFNAGTMAFVPQVVYLRPGYNTVVDLTGKDGVIFEWNRVPIPSGGRDRYRFALYREEPSHAIVLKEDIDDRTFSIQVSADKFEEGVLYSWYVKQRDASTMSWSRFDKWFFRVKKMTAK